MKKEHPAVTLFRAEFKKCADNPNTIEQPEYFVGRGAFELMCRKAGIPIPQNFIHMTEWEEAIGLRKVVRQLVRAEHKRRQSKPAPWMKR